MLDLSTVDFIVLMRRVLHRRKKITEAGINAIIDHFWPNGSTIPYDDRFTFIVQNIIPVLESFGCRFEREEVLFDKVSQAIRDEMDKEIIQDIINAAETKGLLNKSFARTGNRPYKSGNAKGFRQTKGVRTKYSRFLQGIATSGKNIKNPKDT